MADSTLTVLLLAGHGYCCSARCFYAILLFLRLHSTISGDVRHEYVRLELRTHLDTNAIQRDCDEAECQIDQGVYDEHHLQACIS